MQAPLDIHRRRDGRRPTAPMSSPACCTWPTNATGDAVQGPSGVGVQDRDLVLVLAGDPLVVPDDLAHDELAELLGERRVQTGGLRDAGEAGDLLLVPGRVRGRQPTLGLELADPARELEALGEQVHEGGVDVVDALAE